METNGSTPSTPAAPTDARQAGALAGCTALVTGASSGIGAAAAVELARHGAQLALVARRADRLDDVVAQLPALGGAPLSRTTDLSDTDQARQAVQDTVDHFGRLDILVNNAGFGARSPVEDSELADWERMVDLNVKAVLHTSHAALPHLLEAADGPRGVADVVNVSSVAGRVARRGNSVYSATKHAVGAFSEAMRQEVTGRGVRVGLVEPGMTATELTADRSRSAGDSRGMPQEVWLQAADIARSVAFMVTQPAHAAVNEITVRPTAQEH